MLSLLLVSTLSSGLFVESPSFCCGKGAGVLNLLKELSLRLEDFLILFMFISLFSGTFGKTNPGADCLLRFSNRFPMQEVSLFDVEKDIADKEVALQFLLIVFKPLIGNEALRWLEAILRSIFHSHKSFL